MEILKLRVRPKNSDRKLRTLYFQSFDLIDMNLVRSKLQELFPFGYFLDEDKIERRLIDFVISDNDVLESCSHHYLDKYKPEPIKHYTENKCDVENMSRCALDTT